jgi:hypothetical protein
MVAFRCAQKLRPSNFPLCGVLCVMSNEQHEILIDNELKRICTEVIDLNYPLEKWMLIESCDMFQTENYCGGFDADDKKFCFSHFAQLDKEYWFYLTLDDIQNIVFGVKKTITLIEVR